MGNLLKLIRSIYKNPTPNIKLNGERLSFSPLRSGTKDICSHHSVKIVLRVLTSTIDYKRKPKSIQVEKEEIVSICG